MDEIDSTRLTFSTFPQKTQLYHSSTIRLRSLEGRNRANDVDLPQLDVVSKDGKEETHKRVEDQKKLGSE